MLCKYIGGGDSRERRKDGRKGGGGEGRGGGGEREERVSSKHSNTYTCRVIQSLDTKLRVDKAVLPTLCTYVYI